MQSYIKNHKLEIIIVSLITLLALVLRLIALHNFGEFWIDEIFSSYFACKNSAIDVVKSLYTEDLHVPLYFVLLHYWTKLFGNSETTMRLMGCIISTLSVPAVFYVIKDLFKNKFSAAISAIFIAFSAFNIHYCVELRFYGMSVLFAIISTYFFTKYIQNFDRKNITLYIISTLLLLYTYNFSFMYVFCQFVVALIYLTIKERKQLLKLFLIYFVVGIFYLPVLIMIFSNVFKYNTAILKFVRDVFYFDITWFETYFITVFSNLYDQFIMNEPLLNTYYLKHFFKPQMFFGVFLLVFFGLGGMILGLSKSRLKNKNLFFFIMPALLLFFIQILLVTTHALALIYRYTIITTTLLLIISVLGYSECAKHRKLCLTCLFIWLFLNISSYFYITKNHPVLNRKLIYTINLEPCAKNLDIKNTDIVLMPSNDKLFVKQVPYGKHFDINLYDALYIGIRPKDIEFVFGKELASLLNRKYAKTYLYKYIVENEPLLDMKNNINNKIFSKMRNGDRFIIVTDETLKQLKYNQAFLKNSMEAYRRSAIGNTLMAKIISDMIDFASETLTYKEHIEVSKMFDIYVFEK
ncbi:glycosyltransferase family 39 protein [bacterium]|nr:glycosyltransferase family 39 protein [bacterium]